MCNVQSEEVNCNVKLFGDCLVYQIVMLAVAGAPGAIHSSSTLVLLVRLVWVADGWRFSQTHHVILLIVLVH